MVNFCFLLLKMTFTNPGALVDSNEDFITPLSISKHYNFNEFFTSNCKAIITSLTNTYIIALEAYIFIYGDAKDPTIIINIEHTGCMRSMSITFVHS